MASDCSRNRHMYRTDPESCLCVLEGRCSRTCPQEASLSCPEMPAMLFSESTARTLKPCMDFPFLFFSVLKTERFHGQGEQKLFAESLTCKAHFHSPTQKPTEPDEVGGVGGVGWGFAPLYKILLLPCGGLARGGAWNSC